MPFSRGGERNKYGYMYEIEYENGDLDSDSASNNLQTALKELNNFKNERGVKTASLYPKNESGHSSGDPIKTVRGKPSE
jgi:hypothetical protein